MRLTAKPSTSKLRQISRFPPMNSEGLAVDGADDYDEPDNNGKRNRRGSKKSYAIAESESADEDPEMPDLGDEEDDDEDLDDEKDGDDYGSDLENLNGDEENDFDVQPPTGLASKSNRHEIMAKKSSYSKVITKSANGRNSGLSKQRQTQQERSDDEELSELESGLGEDEESMLVAEEDSEIEKPVTRVKAEEFEESDEELDVDGTLGTESRASTPDLNKLTRRQRARFEESNSGFLMALPDEVQVKKHLTAEEHAMRRAEMARRRKNLSEKRNEEEKLETINKLLKKRAPKTNARRRELNAPVAGDNLPDDTEASRPDPIFVRWVSSKEGNKIGIPEEWVNGSLHRLFKDTTVVGEGLGLPTGEKKG